MDKKNKIPLYLQLMQKLINKINNQEYTAYDKLPSERELCELYSLSRITVRQALQELEREGYIYKKHGKGTYVAPKSINQQLVKLYSFTEEMKKIGKIPTTKVLSFEEMAVDERMATKMGLNPLDTVFKIKRLRLANNEALIYETSFVPKKKFPNLTKEDLIQNPMYDVFQNDYRIGVTKAIERFSATSIRKEEAEYLNTTSHQPAMLIKRYAYHQDILIEYTISVARGDKIEYTVELT